ncbi:MAG TPA: DUF3300 domain-containing protein [Usitatibacter sp.]|nr:DUF3300 domain-containing protein [Usitatibacter sp.]
MRRIARWFWIALGALFATTALAQEPERRPLFSPAELDQMVAPIALYPDSLLSQVLMASTYPRDLAEAASWSRVHGLRGEEAVRAAGDRDWDPSVTSLVAFPEVLAMLDERQDWSGRLGEAFLSQPGEVMDSVQGLRARADAAGTLRSSEEMMVQRQGEDYVIEPTQPEEVYVPYYDPREAYGTWGWPAYQPVYWAPWPGYSYGYGCGLCWGPSAWVGAAFFYSRFDWHRHHVRYTQHRPWYHHGRNWRAGGAWGGGDSDRRRDQGGWRRGDGRWDGRNRDDGRYRDDGRSRGDGSRRVAAPSTSTQGFFRPGQSPQSPAYRASSERARAAAVLPQTAPVAGTQPSVGGHPMMRSVAPQIGTPGARVQGQGRRQYVAPPTAAVPQAPAPSMPAQRSVQQQRSLQQHSAPVHQAPSAPAARAPTQRSRESSAPAARESAPSRSSSSESSGPAARAERGRAASR